MSALAMILTAAMVVPGDGPEKVSGEMARERKTLNLKGQWKAVLYGHGPVFQGEATVVDREFRVRAGKFVFIFGEAVDEGDGNLRMCGRLGIYKQDGDQLRICLSHPNGFPRPTSFKAENRQCLIELTRIRPAK